MGCATIMIWVLGGCHGKSALYAINCRYWKQWVVMLSGTSQHRPELVRLCDEMGFMMMIEPFEWDVPVETDTTAIFSSGLERHGKYATTIPEQSLWWCGASVMKYPPNAREGLRMAVSRYFAIGKTLRVRLPAEWTRSACVYFEQRFCCYAGFYRDWIIIFTVGEEAYGNHRKPGVRFGNLFTVSSRGVYKFPAKEIFGEYDDIQFILRPGILQSW